MVADVVMSSAELFELSKRMVVEYYNRYVHNEYNRIIGVHEIELVNIEHGSDNEITLEMMVVCDNDLMFVVAYNPENKNKPISSYIRRLGLREVYDERHL